VIDGKIRRSIRRGRRDSGYLSDPPPWVIMAECFHLRRVEPFRSFSFPMRGDFVHSKIVGRLITPRFGSMQTDSGDCSPVSICRRSAYAGSRPSSDTITDMDTIA